MKIKLTEEDALIVVDVQNDFLPGGTLGVPNGDKIIPVIKQYLEKFREKVTVFSRDWHPKDHCSFKDNGGRWPSHCVAKTTGANFSKEFGSGYGLDYVISKGADLNIEEYSAFDGTGIDGRRLNKILDKEGIKNVFVCGLATDYCVLATVKDAIINNYNTFFLLDASAAVNDKEKDEINAINTMACYGAFVVKLENFE